MEPSSSSVGGAYVPPHRRGQVQVQSGGDRKEADSSWSSYNNQGQSQSSYSSQTHSSGPSQSYGTSQSYGQSQSQSYGYDNRRSHYSNNGYSNNSGNSRYRDRDNRDRDRDNRDNRYRNNYRDNRYSYGNRGGGGRFRKGWGGGYGGRSGGRYGEQRRWNDDLTESELFDDANEVTQGINFDMYDKIPVDVGGVDPPQDIPSYFEESGLHDKLLDNIKRCKYTKLTPIQKYAIPFIMAARDVMACAQTGSGKTAAFLLPCLHLLLANGRNQHSYTPNPAVVVLSPTRELAIQIHKQAQKFMFKTGLRSVVVYGGADARSQIRQMEKGVDVVVATPGRLIDFIERRSVSMSDVRYCILDEADRMLDMGFMPQIKDIIKEMPRKDRRQTSMFSATFPLEIQRLAQEFLNEYLFIAVGTVGSTNSFITQKLKFVEKHSKLNELLELLPDCDGLKLIFVETRRDADSVERQLVRHGLDAISIHGNRSQQEREHALRMFRSGKTQILVATDVAARGLDIPNVMWVVNYDLPNNIEAYVHRIGRTGRCGNAGTAIAFVNEDNKPVLKDLYKLLRDSEQKIPQWFSEMSREASYGYGKRKQYNRYGGRDFRRGQKNNSNYSSRRFYDNRRDTRDRGDRGDRGMSSRDSHREQKPDAFAYGNSVKDSW